MSKPFPPNNIIVYADDDPDDLQLLSDSFHQYSDRVELLTFCDGIQALTYLQNISPNEPLPCLIILDVNMPRLDGKELLKQLRQHKRFAKVPVVLFTTSSLESDKDFALKHNAGFLTKPIDMRQMEIITDQFIDHCTDDIREEIRRKVQ